MGLITLICGSAMSDRSERIDAVWHEEWGRAFLLTPTRRMSQKRQESFVRKHALQGIWGEHAMELSAYSRYLLETMGVCVRMVSQFERRVIVRTVLEELQSEKTLPGIQVTPGLVRHMVQLITQVKQAGIEPVNFREALLSSGEGYGNGGIVADVYDGYQKKLLDANLYDVPGLYWEGSNRCQSGNIRLPGDSEIVLLDGFDDFTPSQQRFLVSLARHTRRMIIGINYDADPDRGDLFHLQSQWVAAFQKQVEVEVLACQTRVPRTAGQYAAGKLFRRNPAMPPEKLRANLHIAPCADVQHEMEFLGRAIKQVIVQQGISPADIAVALTDMSSATVMLTAVFEEFGVPYNLKSLPSLYESALGCELVRLFDLVGRWERETLVALLTSPMIYCGEHDQAHTKVFPLILRHIGVLAGRHTWMQGIEELEARITENGAQSRDNQVPDAISPAALAAFKERMATLAAFEDDLPETATLGEYARFCDRYVTSLGLEKAAQGSAARLNAILGLRSLLGSFTTTSMNALHLDARDFSKLLFEGMQEVTVPVEGSSPFGVYCCDIEGLRCESFSHVFVGGLNEGLLPRPSPQNALYAEMDMNHLRRQGIMLSGRSEHTYRERLLFYHALCAGRDDITLSWRKQDRTGRDALPSPFVVDVMDLFPKTAEIVLSEPGPDCFIPEPEAIASSRDLLNVLFYHDAAGVWAGFEQFTDPVRMRAEIESLRYESEDFSIFDGIIQSPDLLEWLGETFGPEKQFSVGQLESYIQCPFDFFMTRILGVRETTVPDGELDPLVRGALLHEILQRFHEHYKAKSVEEVLAADEPAARACLNGVVHSVFERRRNQMKSVPSPVILVEERRFLLALDRYLDAERERGSGFSPQYFEVAFGRTPGDSEKTALPTAPFALRLEDGSICLFSGKIDRIDVAGKCARIIDYKSASCPDKKEIVNGTSLQLTLYQWAVHEHLLKEYTVEDAYYIPLFKGKPREALFKKKEDDWQKREDAARQRILSAVQGIRRGYFPPIPDPVAGGRRKPLSSAARYEKARIERKQPSGGSSYETDEEEDK